jgi:hypothetical protein
MLFQYCRHARLVAAPSGFKGFDRASLHAQRDQHLARFLLRATLTAFRLADASASSGNVSRAGLIAARMSSLNAGESTAYQSFALTWRGLLFFAMIGGAFFAATQCPLEFVMNRDQADDLKLFFPGWRGHFDFVADFAIEERFANGGGG